MCASPRRRRRRPLLAVGLGLWIALAPTGDPVEAGETIRFADVTAEAGLEYRQHDLNAPPDCLLPIFQGQDQLPGIFCEPERMSGGVAVGDADGDGLPDLFVTRLDDSDLLFRNRGDGSFEDVSTAAGLAATTHQSNGAAWGDVDNDGDLDLYVTTLGDGPPNDRFYLYVNDGSGHFTEEGGARGAALAGPGPRTGFSATFGDYDRDGWLDLHTTEWRAILNAGPAPEPVRTRLLRNLGPEMPGHFEDVTEAAGVRLDGTGFSAGSFAFSSTFVDLDDDGWPEIAVAADFDAFAAGGSRLFWNQHDGSFADGTDASGVGTDENGMGSAFGDLDGDGDLDWFVSSIYDPDPRCAEPPPLGWGCTGNRLYRNEGDRLFSDQTDHAGVRDGGWGWGAAFLDADNDGDQDLVMANGVDFPGQTAEDPFNVEPMRYWENDGEGRMTERAGAVGLVDTRSGKGLASVDYDADGDLDLVVVANGAGARLYRNDGGNANDWLRVEVVGASGRDAIGARIELLREPGATPQVRQIGVGGAFLAQSERVAHFGLGPGPGPAIHEVRVDRPGQGAPTQRFRQVARNQVLRVPEPTDAGSAALATIALMAAGRSRSERARSAPPRDFPSI